MTNRVGKAKDVSNALSAHNQNRHSRRKPPSQLVVVSARLKAELDALVAVTHFAQPCNIMLPTNCTAIREKVFYSYGRKQHVA